MEAPALPSEWSSGKSTYEPFVFRSGGLFGSGKKVSTIGAAVKHMDRHPDAGIYHLQNGTLAQWLEGEDAHELADLAHEVANAGYTDPRVMLETFLLGTGLVRRPRLSLNPASMWLGYILAGQTCSHDLQIKRGRGRGYLFGRLHCVAPWISLEPTGFSGRSVKVSVQVDTRTLPISNRPHEAQIAVESSASEAPVLVPVRFRVMGVPSKLNRHLIRPLANLLVAAPIGAVLGWLLAQSGVGLPASLAAGARATPVAVWTATIAALWALVAVIRGFRQPLAWPLSYTLGRGLLRTVVWAITLVLVAAAALFVWHQLHTQWNVPAPFAWSSSLLGACALSVLPAVIGELWISRGAHDPTAISGRIPVLKPGLLLLLAAILCVMLLVGVRYVAPALQEGRPQSVLASAEAWTSNLLTRFETRLNDAIDRAYLSIYDRRAPTQPGPTATTPPTTPAASTSLPPKAVTRQP